jgi:hypothetical protein
MIDSSYETHEFNVSEFGQKFRMSYDEFKKLVLTENVEVLNYERHHVVEHFIRTFFATSQPKVSSKRRETERFNKFVPETLIDCFKEKIVKFSPALKFGWLIPKYQVIVTHVTELVEETAINVYPVPLWQAKQCQGRIRFPELQRLTPVDWLLAEPCSFELVNKARMEKRTKPRMHAEQVARIIAELELF